MKHIGRLLAALLILGTIVYFVIPVLFLPSGVWHRRVVRNAPLKAPISVSLIRGNTLVGDSQEFRLAGVILPEDAAAAARAAEFLRVVTAQGIEVIRPVQPDGTFLLRCEPRIWHWCGNDSVKAHYEQFNLNELLIAFGYATPDPNANGLNDNERLRLMAAEALAKEEHRGMWTDQPGSRDSSFRPKLGLNISDTLHLPAMIGFKAEELARR